jgi:hypothetical protein
MRRADYSEGIRLRHDPAAHTRAVRDDSFRLAAPRERAIGRP